MLSSRRFKVLIFPYKCMFQFQLLYMYEVWNTDINNERRCVEQQEFSYTVIELINWHRQFRGQFDGFLKN